MTDHNQRQQESAPEHRDYAGELADAAEAVCEQQVKHARVGDDLMMHLALACRAYRNQPQVTCRECERREREIERLVFVLKSIERRPTVPADRLAKEALDAHRKGREAKA